MAPHLSKRARLLLLSESTALKLIRLDPSRRFWVHETNRERSTLGEFHQLYSRLRMDAENHFEYLRMSIETFDVLLSILRPSLEKIETNYRKPISPEERLVLTIRYLATGASFRSLAFSFRMGKSTISSIVKETCTAIWDILQPECLPSPTEEMWIKTAEAFSINCSFPNCLGSINGRHIKIKCPKNSSNYHNYKQFNSIVLQAVADSDYKFVVIDVGCPGQENDGGIFRSSKIYQHLKEGTLNVPADRVLPNMCLNMPFTLVADEAYPLLTFLMRPYPPKGMDRERKVFNCRLSKAQRTVECAFEMLTSKWGILSKCIETSPAFAETIVKATCILHNLIINREGIDSTCLSDIQPQLATSLATSRSNNASTDIARTVRNKLKDYFNSPVGEVPWQYDYLLP